VLSHAQGLIDRESSGSRSVFLPSGDSAPAEILSATAGKLAGMSAWQYAQLTIKLEGRSGEGSSTTLWREPGQGLGENFSDSGQTVLELMNKVGADGWELAGLEERREGGDGRTYWDAAWSLSTYTFKRLVPE
jgi:hypothetical protein